MTPYTDHPEYLAQLAGILAMPEDDLPRLVLADWLDEREEGERAEFIRVQIELAKWPCETNTVPGPPWEHVCGADERGYWLCQPLRSRERDLFKLSGPAGWWGDLPGQWRSTGDDMRIETANGWSYTTRRGFVAEARCTLTDWIGGECGRCSSRRSADGHSSQYRTFTDCPNCSGTGHIPGIGPAVVAAHPVQVVTTNDKEPRRGRYNYSYGWGWWRSGDADAESLPRGVFDLMCGGELQQNGWMRVYTIREAANDALSAACIAWAKAELFNSLAFTPNHQERYLSRGDADALVDD